MRRGCHVGWWWCVGLSACTTTLGATTTEPSAADLDQLGDSGAFSDPGTSDSGVPGDSGGSVDAAVCASTNVLCVDDEPGASREYPTIQAAVDMAGAGDTVLVFPGDFAGFRVDRSGTAEQRLVVRTASAGVNLTSAEAGSNVVVRISAASYVTIEGFVIARPGTVAEYDYNNACVAARDTTVDLPMRGLVIRNNDVSGCSPAGMYFSQCEGMVIEGNRIHHHVRESVGGNGQAIYLANAATDNVTIRGNVIVDNQGPGIHFNGDSSIGGDGIQTGHLIENNLFAGNGQNGLNMDGVQSTVIRNNVFADNARSGVRVYQIDAAAGPLAMVIVNNTFVGNRDTAAKLSEDLGGHVLFNNLLVANADNSFVIDETTEQAASNVVLANLSGVFVAAAARDYRLLAESAAVNAGVTSFAGTDAPNVDLNGFPRDSTPDAGAFELGSAP